MALAKTGSVANSHRFENHSYHWS